MPPKRPIKDRLSDAEWKLLGIAARMDAAMRYLEEHPDELTEGWLVQGIEDELVCDLFSYMAQITY
jgi:hypothetical protein